jgi:hypothetical protein
MTTKEFTKTLDKNGEDRLRIRVKIDKGKLVDIMVQYESLIGGHWSAIVRYGMEHGFFHRDLLNPKGEKIKTSIEMPDLKTAAIYAEQDIKDKWEFHKEKFIKQIKHDKQRNGKS